MGAKAKRLLAILGLLLTVSGCRNQSPSMATARTPTVYSPAGTATASVPGSLSPTPTGSLQVTKTITAENTPSNTEPTPTGSAPVDVSFVGDIMLGRSLAQKITQGKGGQIFESARTVLQSADITVGNLECAIGEGGIKARKAYTFLAPPLSGAVLKNAGFTLLSLANNHSLDYGPDVFRQTQQILMENGIQFVGAGEDASQAGAPVVYEIRGLRLAFLAYADVPAEREGFNAQSWTAGKSTPGISWADDEKIISDLQSLRTRADFIVVLFHYGIEGSDTPSPRQEELSHLAVDNGADLVVGSHPHLLQKEETYKSRWIFYSMGNFVFDGFSGAYNHGAILRVTVSLTQPVKYTMIPVILVDGIPFLGQQ